MDYTGPAHLENALVIDEITLMFEDNRIHRSWEKNPVMMKGDLYIVIPIEDEKQEQNTGIRYDWNDQILTINDNNLKKMGIVGLTTETPEIER